MNQAEKQEIVSSLSERLSRAGAFVLADFSKMTVAEADALRVKFAEAGATYQVIKNTLLRRAVEGTDMEVVNELCVGPTAIAIGYDDPSAPARLLGDFIKDSPKHMTIKGGYLEGQMLDEQGVKQLATMPTLPELRAQILGCIQGVSQKLVSQVAAPMQQIAGVIQAHVDEEENK